MTHHQLAFGEVLTSFVPIQGALPAEPTAIPTIIIESGRVTTGEGVRASSGPYELCSDGSVVFVAPGVGRYRCSPDGRLVIDIERGAEPAHVEALLRATALPAMIWLLDPNSLLVHAAAVVPPGNDRAIAIAAPSSGGKSTVLDRLLSIGYSVVADDVVRVRSTDHETTITGLPSAVQRRTGRSDALGDVRSPRSVPLDRCVACAPLGRLVFLARERSTSPHGFVELAPLQAVTALLGHRHRAMVPALLDRERLALGLAGALLRSTEVRQWRRAEGTIEIQRDELQWLVDPLRVGTS